MITGNDAKVGETVGELVLSGGVKGTDVADVSGSFSVTVSVEVRVASSVSNSDGDTVESEVFPEDGDAVGLSVSSHRYDRSARATHRDNNSAMYNCRDNHESARGNESTRLIRRDSNGPFSNSTALASASARLDTIHTLDI
jgi:hypothetical protein